MKKTVAIILLSLLMVMCKTPGGVTQPAGTTAKADTKVKKKDGIQYRDDFTSASEKEKAALLSDLKAAGAGFSVLIFTQNFKGEKVIVSNAKKQLYNDYTISNLKSGVAGSIRIDNTVDTKVFDNLTNKEVVIEAEDAKKHKFIYLMKNPGGKNAFTITYSNTLRPLK